MKLLNVIINHVPEKNNGVVYELMCCFGFETQDTFAQQHKFNFPVIFSNLNKVAECRDKLRQQLGRDKVETLHKCEILYHEYKHYDYRIKNHQKQITMITVEKVPSLQAKPKEENTILNKVKTVHGWRTITYLKEINRVVYLGKCSLDGDVFAVYHKGNISFAKGSLNNGIFNNQQA